jgi:hypothetical protein
MNNKSSKYTNKLKMSYFIVSYDSENNKVRYKIDKHIADQCVLIQELQPEENEEINTIVTYTKEEIETTIRFLEYFYGTNNIIKILKNTRDFDDSETIVNLIKTFNKLFKLTFNTTWSEYFSGASKLDNPFLQWLAFDLDDYPDIKYFLKHNEFPKGRLSLLNNIGTYGRPKLKNLINIEDIELFNRFRPFQPLEGYYLGGKCKMIVHIIRNCSQNIIIEIIRRYPELINNPEISEKFVRHLNVYYENIHSDEICNAIFDNIDWVPVLAINNDYRLFRLKHIRRFIDSAYIKSKNTEEKNIIDFNNYVRTFRAFFRRYFERNLEHFGIINFHIDDYLVNKHKINQEEPVYHIIRNTILNL